MKYRMKFGVIGLAAVAILRTSGLAQAATILQNYTATNSSDSTEAGRYQADADIAVGPSDVVELINGTYAVFSKSNGAELTSMASNTFWDTYGGNVTGSRAFNQRVLYDPSIQRWIAGGLDNPGGTNGNHFLVAISKTSDPTQGWNAFDINSASSTSDYGDWPTLGYNKDAISMAANIYPAGYLVNTLTVPLSSLTANTPSVSNDKLYQNVGENQSAISFQQTADLDDTSGKILSWDNDINGNGQLAGVRLWTQAEVNGVPTGAPTLAKTISMTAYDTPGFVVSTPTGQAVSYGAPQPGGVAGLDLSDGRLRPTFVLSGGNVWGTQDVDITGAHGTQVAIRWFEINPTTQKLEQQGLIEDTSSTPLSYYYSSIAVNSAGKVVIGCSGSSTSVYASAYAFVGTTTNGVTTFGSPMELAAGTNTYVNYRGGGTGPNGWGYYSTTVVDPSNSNDFWTVQEYASAKNVWSTQVSEISVAVPEPTSLAGLAMLGLVLRRPSRRKSAAARGAMA